MFVDFVYNSTGIGNGERAPKLELQLQQAVNEYKWVCECVCQCKQVNDDNMLHRCHISLSISCSPKLKDASIKPSNESMSAFIAPTTTTTTTVKFKLITKIEKIL